MACNIQNTYLTVKCQEIVHTIARPEFETMEGSIMIIKIALCVLKSNGGAFHAKLAKVIYELDFRP